METSKMQFTSQANLRAQAIAALQPVFVGQTVKTGSEIMGHDQEVQDQVAICTAVSLLEEMESDILLTLDIPGYGPANILLEELV
jgi:acyl dehydratase